MGQLDGKICLITGAGRGIGAAAASRFSAEGAIVYAAGRNVDVISAWSTEDPYRRQIIPTLLDVRDPMMIKQVLMHIKKEQGKLDVLVNNAAIEKNERIGMISRQSMHDMFETNVYGVIELLQLAARIMQRGSGGSIINVASRVGERGNAGQLVYSATKGAVISITRSAAKELTASGVRVNAVSPGLTDTEMFRSVSQDKLEERLSTICAGRPAKPEEIADAMVFLASDRSAFISGQIINVDGCTII